MSSSFERDAAAVLEQLIKKHHVLYGKIFHCYLVCKLHFWVHYPEAMKQHGPLRYMSTIRGEAKHRFFTKIAASVSLRRNPSYTSADLGINILDIGEIRCTSTTMSWEAGPNQKLISQLLRSSIDDKSLTTSSNNINLLDEEQSIDESFDKH
ncbi:hypothetical protein HCN44_004860 [Aphidius gifuensis]|uniref:Uncharacterized protein n=1 Tax=Aphidius gifuensis TaxID=684658 RepID=A0A834XTH2_APHGI|nr:hypothetical protein HCN44_004860 [Aphidius gifuensis]